MSSRLSHIAELHAALGTHQERERLAAAHNFLRAHLTGTRETAIGRDFLFAADAAGVGAALKDLVAIEHEHGKDLHFDYAGVGGYFLLRIVGSPEQRAAIDAYFE
jgi:hypothetical protein